MKHLLLLSVLLAVLLHDAHAGGCLQNKTNIKRYVHYVGEALDLTIDTSRRISHRLVSNVIKIILEEVLGYQSVKILPETQKNTSTIFRGFPYAKSPVAMVNLEVLLTPDVKVNKQYDNHAAKDSGVIARSGRYGWFVPEELTSRAPAADQWTFFKSNQAGVFDLKDQDDINLIQNTSINSSTSRFYCEETYCNHGTFEPSQCHNLNNECALLLTSYPDSTGFVVDHIKALKLNVKVVWLGPNLANVVRALNRKFSNIQNSNQSLIFLEWTPEYSGMADLKVARVTMPNCETVPSFLALGCKYEMTRIVKLTWNRLRDLAKPAYNMIDDISFSAKEYQELIQYYNKTNDFESAACYWMKDHVVKWTNWTAGTTKEILYIAGIYPMSVKSYNGFSIASAANMAVQAINDNTEVLRDYTLQHLISDGKCQADLVMKSFIDYVNSDSHKRMIGLLGPACSEAVEPLVGVARHYNVVAISYSAEGTSFTDRKKYPYFFRTIGENKQFTYVYSYLFNLMNWKRVAALSEDGQKYTEYISFMGNEFKKNKNSTLQLIENIKFPRERKDDVMDGEMSARVIIADVADSVARQLMCQAYHRRMTAAQGYTWFLPSWFSPDWYNTNITSSTPHNNSNTQKRCSVDQMIEAINGHFSISQAQFADDDDLMQENITVGQWRHQYKAQPRILPGISPYIGYAYDAVWTYALAFDKLIKQHPEALSTIHTQSTAQKLTDLIGDLDFNGVSGNIKFRRGSSRYSVINIFQWINKTNVLVGSFTPKVDDNEPIILGGKLKFNESKVVWLTPDGKRPNDGEVQPSCAFGPLANLLQISCDGALIVFNIFIFLVLGIIILVSFFYIKRRYDRRIQETKKFMMTLGLDVLAASKFSTLDKWEIPRDRVVINRKLGEGAFGTVYGGEANFPEGRGWTAVAVKTLKVGSDTEEKLDFLSEAEAMKRFEHKNIVKLLAVCTKTEPVYAIMEFMLYGDLKTYLLARRHLVNEKYTEESEDISNKKLTSMALDVARALSYLADLKYVHRDVACRNCLVNSNRVVKLGDFGMTRLIFESDYYKFSRKGMLPVRWMSPESLGLGIFSPASDVWSYGVLLYEIITFGSFPFQGYSNNQVLEYVKKGNTITIPKGVKPQLEGLIKSCWKVDHKARPQASEIVEFLANSPRLLSPCLDVPLSSVQRDNSDELPELPAPLLPDHLRKCSVSVAEGTPSLECRPPVAPTAPLKLSNGIAKHLVVPSVVSSSATNPTYMSADFGDTSSFDDAFDNTPVFNRKPIKIGFKSNDFREEEVSFV